MAEDTTVVEHLLEGRRALEREVERLTAAMEQLDSVIALFGTGAISQLAAAGVATSALARTGAKVSAPTSPRRTASTTTRKPPASRGTSAPSRGTASTRAQGADGESPKSIREHVLEMLAQEDREVGLAEIIDRIHGAGVQAHDDAVRSITIKLMKDGQVERVGRGQYRLAGRGKSDAASTGRATLPTTSDTQQSDGPSAPEARDEPARNEAPSGSEAESAPETPDAQSPDAPSVPQRYAPPLNLGQPWS